MCSQNSARSQLAESYWRTVSDIPVVSGGTHPAGHVHPRAVTVGRRHGLDLTSARPRLAADVLSGDELVIAVCDRAYEDLDSRPLHWSIPDPALTASTEAFEGAFDDITGRINQPGRELPGRTVMTTAPHPVSERSWESLHTDEKLALKQASARLGDDFAGLYGSETIERFLASSFDQFADHATVTRFLPLLAERFARQRLQALARVEGLHDDGKPVVLFLCTHNAGRSQMALGFFQR